VRERVPSLINRLKKGLHVKRPGEHAFVFSIVLFVYSESFTLVGYAKRASIYSFSVQFPSNINFLRFDHRYLLRQRSFALIVAFLRLDKVESAEGSEWRLGMLN